MPRITYLQLFGSARNLKPRALLMTCGLVGYRVILRAYPVLDFFRRSHILRHHLPMRHQLPNDVQDDARRVLNHDDERRDMVISIRTCNM